MNKFLTLVFSLMSMNLFSDPPSVFFDSCGNLYINYRDHIYDIIEIRHSEYCPCTIEYSD